MPGSPFTAASATQFVVIDPAEKFAYGVNESANVISAFAIDAVSGALSPVAGSPFSSSLPANLATDPSGKFVYVAGRSSQQLSSYAVNATSGALTPTVGSPFAVPFRPSSITILAQYSVIRRSGAVANGRHRRCWCRFPQSSPTLAHNLEIALAICLGTEGLS